jgi:outer membrane protein TolC
VIDVVARVEAAYWDLVAARQDVKVKADGVEWAGEQLGRSKRMIDSGTLAPIELSGAQAELDRRLDTYHASIAALTEAENNLKTLVAAGRRQDIWGDVLIPAEERTVEATQYDDLQQAVNLAIQKRPELRQITIRKESNEAQKVLAQDLVKPRINAVVGYVNSGLAGTVPLSSTPNAFTQSTIITTQRLNELSALAGLPAVVVPSVGSVPSSLIGGYGSTLSGLFGGNFPGIQAGLNIDFTTRNRAAEAGVQQNVIAERRLKLEQTRTEQAIAAQVRNSMQAIQSARQRILAAESSAKAAKEKLDSETRLFQSGESTSFLVLTRQNEYTDSLRRVVVSRLDFNKAEARLHQALGTTLETHKVKVQ